MRREVRDDKTHRKLDIDSSLLAAIESVSQKHMRTDQLAGSPEPTLEALPVPSLAFRYLLQNEGLPLGMVYHIVGPTAVFKSTLAVEIGRWHRQCGGGIIICETEAKPTPQLRKSILGWDEQGVAVRCCKSVEQWQKTIMDYIKAIQDRCERDKVSPTAFIVDSYMGKMPERLRESIIRKGFAERHFGEAAMLIGDWLSGYTSVVLGWPFTLIGVNHLKQTVNPITGQPVYYTPGGRFLQHQNVIEIRLTRIKTEQKRAGDIPYYENHLRFFTSKNSRGAQNKSIAVTLTQWNELDDEGNTRLRSNFEWWAASVEMLMDGTGMATDDREILMPLIKKVIDIRKKSRGNYYWCDQLGVPQSEAMPAHQLGMILEEREDILRALYGILRIARAPLFEVRNVDDKQPDKPAALSEAAAEGVAAEVVEEVTQYDVDDVDEVKPE